MTKSRSVVVRAGGYGKGEERRIPRGMRKLLGVIDVFIILSVVMFSLVYTCVKT